MKLIFFDKLKFGLGQYYTRINLFQLQSQRKGVYWPISGQEIGQTFICFLIPSESDSLWTWKCVDVLLKYRRLVYESIWTQVRKFARWFLNSANLGKYKIFLIEIKNTWILLDHCVRSIHKINYGENKLTTIYSIAQPKNNPEHWTTRGDHSSILNLYPEGTTYTCLPHWIITISG